MDNNVDFSLDRLTSSPVGFGVRKPLLYDLEGNGFGIEIVFEDEAILMEFSHGESCDGQPIAEFPPFLVPLIKEYELVVFSNAKPQFKLPHCVYHCDVDGRRIYANEEPNAFPHQDIISEDYSLMAGMGSPQRASTSFAHQSLVPEELLIQCANPTESSEVSERNGNMLKTFVKKLDQKHVFHVRWSEGIPRIALWVGKKHPTKKPELMHWRLGSYVVDRATGDGMEVTTLEARANSER
ncbi:MAG: hypothetical protein MI807_14530 [Verrucomicrobiales bacterium]|nr:hypothetical protein [Verrucomicrobiales bacterium]